MARIYNNPYIGQALDNLSTLFAPPSGQDAYAWSEANATNQKAKRLQDFFTYAGSPGADRSRLDALGVATGTFNPNQSYYAVDQGNQTDLAKNTADNSTRILTNRADNERALGQTGMQVEGENYRAKLKPLTFDPNTYNFTSPEAQAAYPTAPAEGRGIITGLGQGETAVLPWGGRVEGQPKPETTDQVTAAILGQQPQAIKDAFVQRDIPTLDVQGPNGPVIMRRNEAVGQTPVPPAGQKVETQNYRMEDGSQGTAYFDQGAKRWVDTASGQPIAPAATYTGQLQGASGEAFGGATTANMTEGNRLAAVADTADATINSYEQLLQNNPGVAGLPGDIRNIAQNVTQVATELSNAWGDKLPSAAVTLNEITGAINQNVGTGAYDPNIQKAKLLTAELAYRWAQLQNPSGEVSRQAYDRALEALGGGMFANNQSALAGLSAMREAVGRVRTQSNTIRSPNRGAQPTAAAAATTAAPSSTGQASPTAADPNAPRTIQTPAGTVTIQRIQ